MTLREEAKDFSFTMTITLRNDEDTRRPEVLPEETKQEIISPEPEENHNESTEEQS